MIPTHQKPLNFQHAYNQTQLEPVAYTTDSKLSTPSKLLKNSLFQVTGYSQAKPCPYPVSSNLTGGGRRDRTDDPLLAKQVLSQLSYAPCLVGLVGFEPTTPRLSSVCSDQLSYKPRSGTHPRCPPPLSNSR